MIGPTHRLPDGTRVFPEGYDPDDLVELGPADHLADACAAAKASVKALRDQYERAGVTTPYGLIDTDPDSQRKIVGAVAAAQILGAGFGIEWRMADDSLASFDAAQMIEVGLIVVGHVSGCQQRKNELDAAISAAADMAALEAIDITAGWPG